MRPVRLRNLLKRGASALSDVSDHHHLAAERPHDERSGDEPNDGNAQGQRCRCEARPDGADRERRQPARAADEWLEAGARRPSEGTNSGRLISSVEWSRKRRRLTAAAHIGRDRLGDGSWGQVAGPPSRFESSQDLSQAPAKSSDLQRKSVWEAQSEHSPQEREVSMVRRASKVRVRQRG
jgi:hypothetical protein